MLLDHAITDEQVRELGRMLEDDPSARRRYLQNMQLHTGLVEHYNDDRPQPSPVLGMLAADDLLGSQPPIVVPR